MSFTVKKVAQYSGVSVRTLHYYDEVGLLKPAFIGDNGYRYYNEEQLLKLQQILFYRELDLPLADIKKLINGDDFDTVKSLESHRKLLQAELSRRTQLLETVNKTIDYLRGKVKMELPDFFYGFDSDKQKAYEQELLEQGICSEAEIKAGQARLKQMGQAKWDEFMLEAHQLNQELAEACQQQRAVNSAEVQQLIQRHYQWIERSWTPTHETYIALGQQYVDHPGFRAFYDKYQPDLADYLLAGMKVFAENTL